MTTTLNPDGSATYSITVPEPLTITREGKNRYSAGGSVFVHDLAAADVPAWREQIAASIVIHDAIHADAALEAGAAVSALAETLYVADVADLPEAAPFVELEDQEIDGYRKRAAVLDALGVTIEPGRARGAAAAAAAKDVTTND
jgi:hypothetical protein